MLNKQNDKPKKGPISFGLTDLLDKFKGTWVATEKDGGPVICTGDSAENVKRMALEKGYKNPIITCLVDDSSNTK